MPQTSCDDLGVAIPESNKSGGCEILGRSRAYLLDQGWQGQLEWKLIDRSGNPIDFSECTDPENEDAIVDPTVELRLHEAAIREHPNPAIIQATLTSYNPATVRAEAPEELTKRSGLFLAEWGVKVDDKLVLVNRSVVSVDASLFGAKLNYGPPTIQSIRLALRDSDPKENSRLREHEYTASEILDAVLRPIMEWNETPPYVGRASTKSFPYTFQWTRAAIGYLYETAAHNFRRNNMDYSAGGLTVNDTGRTETYEQKARQLLDEWRTFMIREKARLSRRSAYRSF